LGGGSTLVPVPERRLEADGRHQSPTRRRLARDGLPDAISLTEEQKRELDRRYERHLANPEEALTWDEVKADLRRDPRAHMIRLRPEAQEDIRLTIRRLSFLWAQVGVDGRDGLGSWTGANTLRRAPQVAQVRTSVVKLRHSNWAQSSRLGRPARRSARGGARASNGC
jgi:putative addiction module component (TIGR02574 family)